jgi:HAD superfamily hydrolase (TIGR01484 family)
MEEKRALLASDMDGTVIPLEVNPQREKEVALFKTAVEDASHLALAYVTGRDLPLALKGIREYGLPKPDILVCDVGTSVYHSTPSGFGRDKEYVKLMDDARGGLDVREVRHELTRISGLLLQPDERQTESKLSFHLPQGADHEGILGAVQEALDGFDGKLQAVYSVGAPHGRGLLDLLPAGIAKDFAVRYLRDRTGVRADRLVYAGDSGNDLAAMLTGFKVVVVGNSTPGLKEELLDRGRGLGILDRLYFAEAYYVAGVLEGCRHFGIL